MNFEAGETSHGAPAAILKDGDAVICKIFLSPDHKVLRIVMLELKDEAQVRVRMEGHLIDFRR